MKKKRPYISGKIGKLNLNPPIFQKKKSIYPPKSTRYRAETLFKIQSIKYAYFKFYLLGVNLILETQESEVIIIISSLINTYNWSAKTYHHKSMRHLAKLESVKNQVKQR